MALIINAWMKITEIWQVQFECYYMLQVNLI